MTMNQRAACQRNMREAWRLREWERVSQVVDARRPALTVDEIAQTLEVSAHEVIEAAEVGRVQRSERLARIAIASTDTPT